MSQIGILGIPNRTENWKTAKTFAPLITLNKQHQLAALVVGNATRERHSFRPDEVCIELYWKGFRDYCKLRGLTSKDTNFIEKTASMYRRLFPHLRDRLEQYNSQAGTNEPILNLSEAHNYICGKDSQSSKKLFYNLLNTEIDVVLSAPGFLLIGEAKDEQVFNANSRHVLPHQLLRQYVMASIVASMIEEERKLKMTIRVIPFVIGNNLDKFAQVRVLKYLHFLGPENVISWERLSRLTQ